ncbi:hypothetical protein BOTBODRAFT_169363 [Botryobasidium botryosum FD-172 SS1]|uniref:Uncharacterized protein n=1 Tax=Botryobasidium botryosum (strain FD-172 SS1) TaxID=930990 RepID=A0A067N921_BOTB1|nr:hypothetical protein BOTBODRAFT_169363 [Botryobasidium botryosum FD-172 SS1]
MDLTNIPDAASVKALLDKLQNSQALASQLPSAPVNHSAAASAEYGRPAHSLSSMEWSPSDPGMRPTAGPSHQPEVSNQISSLLALLGPPKSHSPGPASSTFMPAPAPPLAPAPPIAAPTPPPPPISRTPSHTSAPARQADVRNLSFQQALAPLGQMLDDPVNLAALKKIKLEQDRLEMQLWEERQTIIRSQEEKVKALQTKARIIGVDPTSRELQVLRAEFATELHRFDSNRVLPAWDALVARQQSAMEKLHVPTIFETSQAAEREKQQKVVQVILDAIGNDAR